MPELPEVETIRLGLEKYLIGHKILSVEVRLRRILTGDTGNVISCKIKGIRRVGKGLIINLDNDYLIAIHIKLTGQLIYKGPNEPKGTKVSKMRVGELPNKWTHVIFNLDKNARLYYNDLRQFGWIKIVESSKLKDESFFKEMGPEPFVGKASSGQATLTLDLFKKIISKSSTKIKPLLMDQKKIGGVGNIYANEALWIAKIDPRRTAKSLGNPEIKKLYNSILDVLKKGLRYGGATEINFVNALGQEGQYQNHFLAYGQDDKPCQRCHKIIKKIKLAGRGTYFCERCQT